MTDVTDDQLRGLINALQLCIQSPLTHYLIARHAADEDVIKIGFSQKIRGDNGLKKFERLMPGEWKTLGGGKSLEYIIGVPDIPDINSMTNFLLLTRLQDDQIVSLASQDVRFRPFAEALELVPKTMSTPIAALSDVRDAVFKTIDKKRLSLKTVAELTGISQVSLSNFKAGNDIRASTLLKIAKALGMKVSLG